MVRRTSIIILVAFLSTSAALEKERGDPNFRRTTNIDVNKVRTTVLNFGISGRAGALPNQVPYEWPVNSGQHYIAMGALAVGAEVVTAEGDTTPIVTIPFRQDQEGNSKSWEPVSGYLNRASDKIAISDNVDTWPSYWPDKLEDENDPGWPGSWNGYFGRNQFNAQQEIYYKISDDKNFLRGYTYMPDSTDLGRRGAGLLTGVRVMEWKQILIEDVVFILHEVKNDGTKDLEKVSFSLWLADLVGGDGDSGDDTPDFDLIYDVAWSMDSDGIGNKAFGTDPVGVASTSFIETPGNNEDRIDNDGDGEELGPIVMEELLDEEILGDAVDNNGNGLIDENMTHVPFGDQVGVSFADRIDNDGDGETDSPVITEEMVAASSTDFWRLWPPQPAADAIQGGAVHLIQLGDEDLGLPFADGIDNNADADSPYALEYPVGQGADVNSPLIDSAMVLSAQSDRWGRVVVPNSEIILYGVGWEDIGKPYADGVDNDGDGAVDEGIDEGIDEMIDESRDDFLDNDGDWRLADDVGIFGDESGGVDAGVNDARPSSGSGTGFPGEPNIDKTDVSESDQMGLTAVGYDPAGSIRVDNDPYLWFFYMTPGNYWQPPPGGQPPGDYDLFVTSGFFPLKAGQTERIAMVICLGNDEADALRNKAVAQTTYDFDYQFARAPDPPQVTSVTGDGKVTLYWDDSAEQSEDRYMAEITDNVDRFDFEGYKVYRATDWEFNDAYTITDGDGNPTFFEPYIQSGAKAQWDLIDGKKGFHPIDLNGVKFYLGDDTGLEHSFLDQEVVNGQTYYYAVVSYDYGGDLSNNIIPSDSPMRLRVNTVTGEMELGPNVVKVIPSAPSAGYVEAAITGEEITHVRGTSTGQVFYDVVDPMSIRRDHTYQVTFTDTVLPNRQGLAGYDTTTTGAFYLTDVTDPSWPDTLVNGEKELWLEDGPVIDGFRLSFLNVPDLTFNTGASFWTRDSLWTFRAKWFAIFNSIGTKLPYDYRIIFEEETEHETLPICLRYIPNTDLCFPSFEFESKTVNFLGQRRVNLSGNDAVDWETIPLAFIDVVPFGAPDGIFNADPDRESDWIVFMDAVDEDGDPKPSWAFELMLHAGDPYHVHNEPQPGDTAYIFIDKPFLQEDVFELTTVASHVDTSLAKEDLKRIKVVPNPYFAASPFEGRNIYTSGRGPREIQFRHLPAKCTIRIYTISGELVKTIDHDVGIDNGNESWDLLTRDNLSAAYGIYLYHVEAPGIGEHVGKFAVVK